MAFRLSFQRLLSCKPLTKATLFCSPLLLKKNHEIFNRNTEFRYVKFPLCLISTLISFGETCLNFIIPMLEKNSPSSSVKTLTSMKIPSSEENNMKPKILSGRIDAIKVKVAYNFVQIDRSEIKCTTSKCSTRLLCRLRDNVSY